MFKCQLCGQLSKPREKPALVVAETRPKVYPPRNYIDSTGNARKDKGGSGTEIVREIQIHRACAT